MDSQGRRRLSLGAVSPLLQIKLLQTKIRCDYSNGKHQRERYARQEKKLLGKIACAILKRETCLGHVMCRK